jgi:hypothetical protein
MRTALSASVLALAGCHATVALPPSELPALTNAEPERTGIWPVVTMEGGKRREVYGHLEAVTIERKSASPLRFPAPIRTRVTGDALQILTVSSKSEVRLDEVAGISVQYDDYVARDKISGLVLLGMGGSALVLGVTMASYGLTEDPGGGIGPTLSLAGLAVSGVALLMMMPGITLARRQPKLLEPVWTLPKASIQALPGGARLRVDF